MPPLYPLLSSIFLLISAAVLYVVFVRPALSLAPWVPTRKEDFEKVNELAALKSGQTLYELGCGDGRVCIAIGKRNPEAHIVGIELSPLLFLIAWLRVKWCHLTNVEIRFGDALRADLTDADVVYAFGLPHTMNQTLKPYLDRHMKRGSTVISYAFALKGPHCEVVPHDGKSAISICRY